jgi:hypothetical protein
LTVSVTFAIVLLLVSPPDTLASFSFLPARSTSSFATKEHFSDERRATVPLDMTPVKFGAERSTAIALDLWTSATPDLLLQSMGCTKAEGEGVTTSH